MLVNSTTGKSSYRGVFVTLIETIQLVTVVCVWHLDCTILLLVVWLLRCGCYTWKLKITSHCGMIVTETVQYVAVPLSQTPSSKMSPYKVDQPQLLPKAVATQHVSVHTLTVCLLFSLPNDIRSNNGRTLCSVILSGTWFTGMWGFCRNV